jgi:cell division protein FtsQ
LIVLGGVLLVAAATFALTWPGFDVRSVAISGNRRISNGEILRRAAIAPGRSIWLENTGAIAGRIRAIPDVASVTIYRIPPAMLRIVVRERGPYAVVRSGDDSAVVDSAMRVLSDSPGATPLPVFVLESGVALVPGRSVATKDTTALRGAYETMTARGLAPATLALDRYGDVVATLPGGLRLLLGDREGLGERIGLAKAIIAQVARGRRRVSTIDVRAPSTPVIEYR